MVKILSHMDIIVYVIQNVTIALLTANLLILALIDRKNNQQYNKSMMFFHIATMAGLCALTTISKKPFPQYQFSEWKFPLFFLGIAIVAGVLWTSFLGLRRNITAVLFTPIECLLLMAAQYLAAPYISSYSKPYLSEFSSVYERIGIVLCLLCLTLIFSKFTFWKVKFGIQIYLIALILGLCFVSETVRHLTLKYLPILIALDLAGNIIEYFWKHRSKTKIRRKKVVKTKKSPVRQKMAASSNRQTIKATSVPKQQPKSIQHPIHRQELTLSPEEKGQKKENSTHFVS